MTAENVDVLVAEDDEKIANILVALLNCEGYTVKHVPDGMAAREYIRDNEPPKLAMLDIMMPYVDGFQLVQEIRANEKWHTIPVAMLTAKSQEMDVIKAIKLGANEYIVKPFQPGELIARLKRIMGG
ncbi:MAG: response regulator transcription factor [Pseudomonadota bacterium]